MGGSVCSQSGLSWSAPQLGATLREAQARVSADQQKGRRDWPSRGGRIGATGWRIDWHSSTRLRATRRDGHRAGRDAAFDGGLGPRLAAAPTPLGDRSGRRVGVGEDRWAWVLGPFDPDRFRAEPGSAVRVPLRLARANGSATVGRSLRKVTRGPRSCKSPGPGGDGRLRAPASPGSL